jgi:preprotein translocase subunit SecG
MVGILLFLHILVSIILILIVLLQVGRISDLGATFGISSSQTLFGPRRGNILTRITAISAGAFMITSLLLTLLIPKQIKKIQAKIATQAQPKVTLPHKLPVSGTQTK